MGITSLLLPVHDQSLTRFCARGTDRVCTPVPQIRTEFPVVNLEEKGKADSAMNDSEAPVSCQIVTDTFCGLPTSLPCWCAGSEPTVD